MASGNYLELCNFDGRLQDTGDATINKLWSGDWTQTDKDICRNILMNIESLQCVAKEYLHEQSTRNQLVEIAIKSFLVFMNQNWNAHAEPLQLTEYLGQEWPETCNAAQLLQRDSEPCCVNVKYLELLYLSSQLFNALYTTDPNLIYLWWRLRCIVVHQRILEDTSATLYTELEVVIAKLTNESQSADLFVQQPRLKILLYTEITQAFLIYRRVQKAEEYLSKAKEFAGLKLELIGVLGKRTKFQVRSLPQLALSSELSTDQKRPLPEDCHSAEDLPPDVELQDDVRADKIQYDEAISQAELPGLEQTVCLLNVQYLLKAQPKDNLLEEELQPYIEAVVSQRAGPWSTRVAALLLRCKLEAGHKRTVERAMQQCETIVSDDTAVTNTGRLSYIWASGLEACWSWRQQLADLYLSLGLVKAALEEYLKLQLWEDVIVCYTMLQLRHKAAEVIQNQINIKPTVKLYCLLGDATDDVSCYELAWEFSNHKSSRAQRHWGNYLFDRKKYDECIPHFEKSVDINSLQERVWLRLGFAALETEQWELSGRAYRRYTYLQPNSFEAWNNLAKVYVKQGDRPRAYRALMEALRFNYDNWKLWENVVVIALDTGHVEDVLRGVHRLLDLTHKYDDSEVLTLLVRAILQDKMDADGNSTARLRKRALELFGRITSVHQNRPELWQLYADLSPTYLLKAQRLLKAYRGYTQNGNWPNSAETCKKVIELATSLLDYSLKARQEATESDTLQANQQLSSARLTGQAVVRAAEKQNWPETQDILDELRTLFNNVTEYMKSIM